MAIPKKAAISLRKLIPILLANLLDGADQAKATLLDSDSSLAGALHLLYGMAYEQHDYVARFDEVLDTGFAFRLEEHVIDGERLICD